MKGEYLLIFSRKKDGGMCPTWHKTQADALEYIMDLPHADWVIIGTGDDGPQRWPNLHPIVLRSKSMEKNE